MADLKEKSCNLKGKANRLLEAWGLCEDGAMKVKAPPDATLLLVCS